MKRVVLNLTDAEAAAILRSNGLHAGHGVASSAPLRSASMKLIGAVQASSQVGDQTGGKGGDQHG